MFDLVWQQERVRFVAEVKAGATPRSSRIIQTPNLVAVRPESFTWEELRTLATSPSPKRLAKDMKARGFRFVGPTTAYAFMEAMGLVNDHIEGCDIRDRVEEARKRFVRPAASSAMGSV